MRNEQLRIREARRYLLEHLNTAERLADSPDRKEYGYPDAYGDLRGTLLVMVNDFRLWLEEIAKETGPVPEYGDMPMEWDAALGQGRN